MTQRKLVLIGGPPCVGKTSVLARLPDAFERCACLDADDVWRIHPFLVDGDNKALAERNVISVLRGYLEAGYPLVFMTWVLANPLLIDRLVSGVEDLCDSILVLHLVASPEVLEARFRTQPERGASTDYMLFKLGQINEQSYPKIDTTGLAPESVAERVASLVERHTG